MPKQKPMTVEEAKTFRTKHGGCRPHAPHKLSPDHPLYRPKPPDPPKQMQSQDFSAGGYTFSVPPYYQLADGSVGTYSVNAQAAPATAPLPGTAPASADYRAEYNATFADHTQGGSGICTGEGCAVAMQWAGYKVQGGAPLKLSAPYLYYVATHDATFKVGTSPFAPFSAAVVLGACLDSVYSEAYMLSQFQGGNVFNASQLPQANAYADARQRKMLKWSTLAYMSPNMNQLKLRLAAGYPVAFGIGNHEMCLIAYDGDLMFAKDSEMAGVDNGYGRGVRAFFAATIASQAYDFCVCEQVVNINEYDALIARMQQLETELTA